MYVLAGTTDMEHTLRDQEQIVSTDIRKDYKKKISYS